MASHAARVSALRSHYCRAYCYGWANTSVRLARFPELVCTKNGANDAHDGSFRRHCLELLTLQSAKITVLIK